jgi:hypothetical protein
MMVLEEGAGGEGEGKGEKRYEVWGYRVIRP